MDDEVLAEAGARRPRPPARLGAANEPAAGPVPGGTAPDPASGETALSGTMLVAGAPVAASRTIGVVNPATGREFARAPDCDQATLDAAVRAAKAAGPRWRADPAARRAALAAAADVLAAAAAELAPLLTAEQGAPLREAEAEVTRAAAVLRRCADLELDAEVVEDAAERIEVRWRPAGPVAVIAPWHRPVLLAAAGAAPALALGCTVVLKPSPYTPLATLALGRLLAAVFPPGVLNIVAGADPLGRRLVAHPGVRGVGFAGSAAAGRQVAAAAAADLKRLTLDLGGNDAAIVLDDADVGALADELFWAAFANCGQDHRTVGRVYAPAARYDDLVEALADRAATTPVGDGMAPATRIGPLATRPQFERVSGLVAAAFAQGARAAAGGRPFDRPGYFFAPTVLAGAEPGMRIVAEETFGPVLPVVAYRDEEEAVALAGAAGDGVCGSVWSADPGRAAAVAGRLDCATAWVNAHARASLDEPFAMTGYGGAWAARAHGEPSVLRVPKT